MPDKKDHRIGRSPSAQTTLKTTAQVLAGMTALVGALAGLLIAIHNMIPAAPSATKPLQEQNATMSPAASNTTLPAVAQPLEPKETVTAWTDDPPSQNPATGICPCLQVDISGLVGHVANNCASEVVVSAMHDPSGGMPAPPFQRAADRKFAQVSIAAGQSAVLNGMSSGAFLIAPMQCPVPVIPQGPPLMCFVKHSTMRGAGLPYERTWCPPTNQAPSSGAPGQTCTCTVDGRSLLGTFLPLSPQPDD